jgi:hypothetical protein
LQHREFFTHRKKEDHIIQVFEIPFQDDAIRASFHLHHLLYLCFRSLEGVVWLIMVHPLKKHLTEVCMLRFVGWTTKYHDLSKALNLCSWPVVVPKEILVECGGSVWGPSYLASPDRVWVCPYLSSAKCHGFSSVYQYVQTSDGYTMVYPNIRNNSSSTYTLIQKWPQSRDMTAILVWF